MNHVETLHCNGFQIGLTQRNVNVKMNHVETLHCNVSTIAHEKLQQH